MLIREHPTKVIEGDMTYAVWVCGADISQISGWRI